MCRLTKSAPSTWWVAQARGTAWQARPCWISVLLPLIGVSCAVKNLHNWTWPPHSLPFPVCQRSCANPTFLYSAPSPMFILGYKDWGGSRCPRRRAGWEGGFLSPWVPLGAQTLKGSSLSNLGVPPGRGNCPLTMPLPFDLIYTDYHGLQQMKQHMGLSFKKYR